MLVAAVALAVGAIPEGLPAAVTIALAIGVGRMADRNAIVRRLPAVETLGSTTVICTDKTGTLTRNEMTVQTVLAGGRRYEVTAAATPPDGRVHCEGSEEDATLAAHPALATCLTAGVLCSDARLRRRDERWEPIGDPTEAALCRRAQGRAGPRRHARDARARPSWPSSPTAATWRPSTATPAARRAVRQGRGRAGARDVRLRAVRRRS